MKSKKNGLSDNQEEKAELWLTSPHGTRGDASADDPTLTAYLPRTNVRTGAAVIICPGGCYCGLAAYEGEDYALFLAQHGVTCFVLKYRLAPHYRHPVMLQDGARAIRFVRAHCDRWGVDTKSIGIMGSSAGGHLASSVMTFYDAPESKPEKTDEIDSFSARPDFGILCYSVISMGVATHDESQKNLLGNHPAPELIRKMSTELQVNSHTPPAFLWSGADDELVSVENSLLFAGACVRHQVPVELHIYEHGRHGLGLGDKPPFHNVHPWTSDLLRWLKTWTAKTQ